MIESANTDVLALVASELQRLGSEVAELRKRLPPRLLPVPEAAIELGVSEATVRRRIRDGEIAHAVVRVGRSVRVNMDSLRAPSEEQVRGLVTALRLVQ